MDIGDSDKSILVSPFLNLDPSFLVNDPNERFIFPDGEKTRGRFERSFSEIGAMVIGGATVGGTRGLYLGLNDPDIAKLPSKYVKNTQLLNHITKSSASLAQTAGSIALIYAVSDFSIHKLRGADDEANTVIAASAAGLIYRSSGLFKPRGWIRCLQGGIAGLAVGLAAVAFSSGDEIKKILNG